MKARGVVGKRAACGLCGKAARPGKSNAALVKALWPRRRETRCVWCASCARKLLVARRRVWRDSFGVYHKLYPALWRTKP